MKIKLFVMLILFISCKGKKEMDFDENDYYKTQGYKVKVNVGFDNFHKIFTKRFVYAYHLDLDKPLIGVTDTDYALRLHEPVVIFVNKKDSLDSFVGHRGITDKKLLDKFKIKIKSDSLNLEEY